MAPRIDPERLHVATPLAVARENLGVELEEVLAELDRHERVEVRAAAIQAVCTIHRRLGIAAVLAEERNRVLLDHLARSGQAYLELLGRVDWRALVDRWDLCASHAAPFLDALAAGDLVRVRAIALLSAPSRSPEDEDEEDYAYMRLLMTLASSDAPPDAETLAAYRAAAEADADAPRAKVVEAILAGDREAFDDALRALAASRADEMDEERRNPSADPVFLLTEAHVFVEGIALARLGALRGVTPIGRIPLIPQPAWRLEPTSFPAAGAWRSAD